jgi:hypothetical protein
MIHGPRGDSLIKVCFPTSIKQLHLSYKTAPVHKLPEDTGMIKASSDKGWIGPEIVPHIKNAMKNIMEWASENDLYDQVEKAKKFIKDHPMYRVMRPINQENALLQTLAQITSTNYTAGVTSNPDQAFWRITGSVKKEVWRVSNFKEDTELKTLRAVLTEMDEQQITDADKGRMEKYIQNCMRSATIKFFTFIKESSITDRTERIVQSGYLKGFSKFHEFKGITQASTREINNVLLYFFDNEMFIKDGIQDHLTSKFQTLLGWLRKLNDGLGNLSVEEKITTCQTVMSLDVFRNIYMVVPKPDNGIFESMVHKNMEFNTIPNLRLVIDPGKLLQPTNIEPSFMENQNELIMQANEISGLVIWAQRSMDSGLMSALTRATCISNDGQERDILDHLDGLIYNQPIIARKQSPDWLIAHTILRKYSGAPPSDAISMSEDIKVIHPSAQSVLDRTDFIGISVVTAQRRANGRWIGFGQFDIASRDFSISFFINRDHPTSDKIRQIEIETDTLEATMITIAVLKMSRYLRLPKKETAKKICMKYGTNRPASPYVLRPEGESSYYAHINKQAKRGIPMYFNLINKADKRRIDANRLYVNQEAAFVISKDTESNVDGSYLYSGRIKPMYMSSGFVQIDQDDDNTMNSNTAGEVTCRNINNIVSLSELLKPANLPMSIRIKICDYILENASANTIIMRNAEVWSKLQEDPIFDVSSDVLQIPVRDVNEKVDSTAEEAARRSETMKLWELAYSTNVEYTEEIADMIMMDKNQVKTEMVLFVVTKYLIDPFNKVPRDGMMIWAKNKREGWKQRLSKDTWDQLIKDHTFKRYVHLTSHPLLIQTDDSVTNQLNDIADLMKNDQYFKLAVKKLEDDIDFLVNYMSNTYNNEEYDPNEI